jgi:hypothetical protein
MKYSTIVISAVILLPLSIGAANAQEYSDSGKYHPFLSTPLQIGLGAYRPTQKNKIGVDADFEDDGNVQQSIDSDDSQTTGMLDFRWRFTDNWSFQGDIWDTNSQSKETLTEDFPFEDETFQAGTFVESGVDTTIGRLFWGRSFNRTPSTDWGVGLGLHWIELDVYVEGQVLLSGSSTGFQRETASASAPLPNFGIWYMHSWSPNWVVMARLDWLDVTFDEFSGSLLDASVGVNYQMTDHFGVGLAVNAFELDVSVDSDSWGGDLETSQYGPRLSLTWNL